MHALSFVLLLVTLGDAEAAKDNFSKEKCPSGSELAGKGPPKGFDRYCQLSDGQRNGPMASWYPNGNVEEHGYWRSDKKTGLWENWYQDGLQKSSCEYQNGQRHGVCKTWYPNGQLEVTTTLRGGLKHGEHKVFYDTGQIMEAAVYADDRLTGIWREWYPSGQKRSEAQYVQGIRSGTWRAFNMQGVVTEFGYFDADWRSGRWEYFFDDGLPKQTGQYRHDLRVGDWIDYYPGSGMLRSKGAFIEGDEHGPWAYYDKAGAVTEYVYYEEGDRIVEVALGAGGSIEEVRCGRLDETIDIGGETVLGWPRMPAENSADEDLSERLAGGWVYDMTGSFSALEELDRFECLATACGMTKRDLLCEEVESVRTYLSVSLELVSRGDVADEPPLIALGQLKPIDEATVIPVLNWLLQASPGETVDFGRESGGHTSAMAAEHSLARNLLPKSEWDAYFQGTMRPACEAFVEATGGEESLWPEVLSAKELWQTEDELVRTVLTPQASRSGIYDTRDLPALNVKGSVSDWIREWPIRAVEADDEVNRGRREHNRLLRTVVLVRVCADSLGSSFGTKYLKAAYGRFRDSSSSGWGFVRLVDQLLEGLPSAERTVGGLWQVHWKWSKENGYVWSLPEYIDRATRWLGNDWRSRALAGVNDDEVATICATAPYPELCAKKWAQLLELEHAHTAANTPAANVILRSGSRGSVRCSGDALAFDGDLTFTVEGYQLPATCLVDIDGDRQVFQVYGSGEIQCDKSEAGVYCDRVVIP
jgi:antitoxin component YwqK of YwqJK toxin-antitoxin module